MPEISRFFGISIRMYFDDHNPPHFHAIHAATEVEIGIEPVALLRGRFPRRRSEWSWSGQQFTSETCATIGICCTMTNPHIGSTRSIRRKRDVPTSLWSPLHQGLPIGNHLLRRHGGETRLSPTGCRVRRGVCAARRPGVLQASRRRHRSGDPRLAQRSRLLP